MRSWAHIHIFAHVTAKCKQSNLDAYKGFIMPVIVNLALRNVCRYVSLCNMLGIKHAKMPRLCSLLRVQAKSNTK